MEELSPKSIVEHYADDVWRYASSKLARREDAEDAVMETFAHAIRDWDRLKKAKSPRLWILAIARNKVNDSLRKRYRRAESPLDETVIAPQGNPSEHREELLQALAGMSELHREILVLKYVNGLSIEEIANVIRRSAAATNSLLQRARQILRERSREIDSQGGTL